MFGQQNLSSQTIQAHAGTVEQILATIDIEPQAARLDTEQGYGWSFRRGSAIIEVYVAETRR